MIICTYTKGGGQVASKRSFARKVLLLGFEKV